MKKIIPNQRRNSINRGKLLSLRFGIYGAGRIPRTTLTENKIDGNRNEEYGSGQMPVVQSS